VVRVLDAVVYNNGMPLLLLMICLAAYVAPASAQSLDDTTARELFKLVNKDRAKQKLPALEWNDQLAQAAQAHVPWMAREKTLSHQFPAEPGLSERVSATELHFDAVAENVAQVNNTKDAKRDAEQANQTLMNSPPHRANILNGKYNSIGIAILRADENVWIVEDFAHSFAQLAVTDVESRAEQAINRLRQKRRLRALKVVDQPGLRQDSCRDDVSPSTLLRHFPKATSSVVYTTWDPTQLLPTLEKMATESAPQSMALAACPAGQQSGHGSYRVAVLFF
jgi:uncharacterized protein YkwD